MNEALAKLREADNANNPLATSTDSFLPRRKAADPDKIKFRDHPALITKGDAEKWVGKKIDSIECGADDLLVTLEGGAVIRISNDGTKGVVITTTP